jgi:hypothetical protein
MPDMTAWTWIALRGCSSGIVVVLVFLAILALFEGWFPF